MMVWCLFLVCLSGTARAEDVILSEEDISFDESTEMEVSAETEVEEAVNGPVQLSFYSCRNKNLRQLSAI